MFQNCSTEEITNILRSFHLPMFAAEREDAALPFRIVCTNDAHQRATGLPAALVEGNTPCDFLTPEEARTVAARYDSCATSGTDLRFVQKQRVGGQTVLWDTSLQYVPLDGGGERIIGTAVEVLQVSPYPLHEDIRYFSSLAELQLQNLTTLLDVAQKQGLFREHSSDKVARLSALCRGVQRAVDDIRSTVHRAGHGPAETGISASDIGGSTLDALIKATSESVN